MTFRRRPLVPLLFGAYFIGLVFLKTPHLLTDPRFWAEEGLVFLKFRDFDFLEALGFRYLATYQAPLNLAVYAATRVSLETAPLVTTLSALLAQTV